jgi:glycerophosphoryl diester phosphodiesterase
MRLGEVPQHCVVTRYGTGSAPLAVAHRGGAGLGLENTMGAFRRSVALGLRYLEFDVRLTADGVPVLFHDAALQRIAGRPGRIDELTLEQLSKVRLPGTTWIPTLADALHAFPDALFMVDMKDPKAIGPVLTQLERHHAIGRSCIAGSFDRRVTEAYGGIDASMSPRLMSVLLACGRRAPVPMGRLDLNGATYAHIPLRLDRLVTYTPRVIHRAHDLGLRLVVWGVEDAATMHRLLDDGVDGIITDHPDRLRDVLIARGQWVPSTSPRQPETWPTLG